MVSKIDIGARFRAHSDEIVEGCVVDLWEEQSTLVVRVASGDLVYNVPASMLVDETKAK